MRLTDMLRSRSRNSETECESREQQASVSYTEQREIHNEERIVSLPIHLIDANVFQPRVKFDEESLKELADSISEHGIMHPVIVRPKGERFELVVGERRLRACKMLGWLKIPAILREMSDAAAAELALIENIQRKDLDFFEVAEGYQRLIEEFSLKQEELAKRIGKSQSTIANKLRLLALAPEVREFISREMLSERHARAVLKLEDTAIQLKVLETVAKKGLNVKQTEEIVKRILNGEVEKTPKASSSNRITIIKDIRLFHNSLRELTNSLEATGLEVDTEEEETEEYFQIVVKIKKPERRD